MNPIDRTGTSNLSAGPLDRNIASQCGAVDCYVMEGDLSLFRSFNASRLGVLSSVDAPIVRADGNGNEQTYRIAARILLRCALSQYTAEHCTRSRLPEQWKFHTLPEGKPIIEPGSLDYSLDFNVTHTEGLIAVAISRQCEVGIDAEKKPSIISPEMYPSILSPRERVFVEQLPAEDQVNEVLFRWTIKEACVKADGRGLQINVNGIEVSTDNSELRLTGKGALRGSVSDWSVYDVADIVPSHFVSLAVLSSRGSRLSVNIRGTSECLRLQSGEASCSDFHGAV